MTSSNPGRYRGPVKAIIFDWAGTVVDHGCLAPAATFQSAFAAFGVPVTVAQARGPMGMAKRDHIKAILDMPAVAEAWLVAHGATPAESDIDAIYERFLPLQVDTVGRHSDLIPGVLPVIEALKARGIRIGSTTGYPPPVMAVVAHIAKAQGYAPEATVCAGDTPQGRPGPFPALKALIDMAISPVEAVVKVGDTPVDVAEGLNGGMWSVAVAATGNELGLTADQLAALPDDERNRRLAAARDRLSRAGAHYVIDSVVDLPLVIDAIEARLAQGEKP